MGSPLIVGIFPKLNCLKIQKNQIRNMESPLNIHGYLPKVKFVLTFDGIFLLEASNHHRYRYSGGGYTRGGPALLGEISLLTTRDLAQEGWKIFIINALKGAGPPRRANKSKLRTYDKVCLGQLFLDKVKNFTSSVCIYR